MQNDISGEDRHAEVVGRFGTLIGLLGIVEQFLQGLYRQSAKVRWTDVSVAL